MFTLLSLMALCAWSPAANQSAQDQNKQDHKSSTHRAKSPAVEVVEMKARRSSDVIEVAAEVKNSGEKPIKNLEVVFQFENSDGEPVSTEEMKVDEPSLMPGEESTLNVQLKDAPMATQIRISAESGRGIELTVGESGPYAIE
jgi:archaellum component FlaF (FlaF/FlaG flagellin family)